MVSASWVNPRLLARLDRRTQALVLVLPLLCALFGVALWPLVRSIWLSLTDAGLGAQTGVHFVGLDNYVAHQDGEWIGVLADPHWWRSVGVTFRFAFVSVLLETVLGVGIALVLNREFPGRAWVRAAVLVPWAVPTIVSTRIWGWMLNDQFGIVNQLLMQAGLIDHHLAWTADPLLSSLAVVLVDVWKTTPFMALMTLAALQGLPTDCFEAARLDGVRPVPLFFRVTLPLIWPPLMVAVLFRMLDALRVFDVIYVLTGNGHATMSMSIFARQQLIDFQDVGYGSAAATTLFLMMTLLVYLHRRLSSGAPGGGAAR
jgi:trehalose/maltose transport system permease protein